MRTALALALLLALAPRAGALFIAPPRGQIAPSPDGRFVFVYVAAWGPGKKDPDEDVIREKCHTTGMYRRGEWDAPLWAMDARSLRGGTFYAANDGVHLAVCSHGPFLDRCSRNRAERARWQKKAIDFIAFDLIANGRYVRLVPASEVIGSARGINGSFGLVKTAEFGADGLFRVVSNDGNRTTWNPATGERLEGRGPNPVADALADVFTDPLRVALLVLGVFGLGVYRAARPRVL